MHLTRDTDSSTVREGIQLIVLGHMNGLHAAIRGTRAFSRGQSKSQVMSETSESDLVLKAFQQAFRPELEAAICCYDFPDEAAVLDSPCGDGFYTNLLARHIRSGTLTAVDLSSECLDRARQAVKPASPSLSLEFHQADAYNLPFDDCSFDFVWCAQSFITLDDPVRALRELARVLRRGGQVAVLETDEYHHVMLPWPVGLELIVQRALRDECRYRYGDDAKFAQSRNLRSKFREAGLSPTVKRTVVSDRSAPFGPAERDFLIRHLNHLRKFSQMELTPREQVRLVKAIDADDSESVINCIDSEMTCISTINHATRE